LQRLEAKGLIKRVKLAKGKGISITFVDKAAKLGKAKVGEQPNGKHGNRGISEIRDAVQQEIVGLQAKIDGKKKFLAELESYAGISKQGGVK
jgi:hypothetical protein